MEFSQTELLSFFTEVSPFVRNLVIGLFAFGEGLPVIGSFLPGGTVAILIGALSEKGIMNSWHAVHIIALGSMLGDLIGFYAGRNLNKVSWFKRFVHGENHRKKWDLFDRHTAIVIILGKLLPVIRSTPALFAGARRMNIFRYIFYVLIASYLWAIAGVFAGKYMAQVAGDYIIPVIFAIVVVSILVAIVSRFKKSS